MKQDMEDENLEMEEEMEEEDGKKNNKKEEDHKIGDNKSINTENDTTVIGGHEKDPMEPEDENMESAEEKVAKAEATKKRKALNRNKKIKRSSRERRKNNSRKKMKMLVWKPKLKQKKGQTR